MRFFHATHLTWRPTSMLSIFRDAPTSNLEESNDKAPASLPHLPIEVWEVIIAFVVHLPGLYAIEKEDPFCLEDEELTKEEIRATWNDLQSVSKVCKAWKRTANVLNCSSIVICCAKHLRITVNTLESSKAADPAGRGLGWMTKRVHLRMRKLPRKDEENLPEGVPPPRAIVAGDLARFFRCTPNLAIYTNNNAKGVSLGSRGRTHPEIMKAMAETCGRSLRRLEWKGEETPAWVDLEALCRVSPNLETLIAAILPLPTSGISQSPVVLPRLHTLSLGLFPNPRTVEPHCVDHVLYNLSLHPQLDQLPALRVLEVTPVAASEGFFLQHGAKLTTLRINFSRFTVPETPERILRACSSNLQSLVFDPSSFDVSAIARQDAKPSASPLSFPRLTRIGLFPRSEHLSIVPARVFTAMIQMPLEEFFEILEDPKRMSVPSLGVIRIREVGSMSDLVKSHVWLQRWWKQWQRRGVRFENRRGEPFGKIRRR